MEIFLINRGNFCIGKDDFVSDICKVNIYSIIVTILLTNTQYINSNENNNYDINDNNYDDNIVKTDEINNVNHIHTLVILIILLLLLLIMSSTTPMLLII